MAVLETSSTSQPEKKLTATLPQLKFQKGPWWKPFLHASRPSPFSTAEPGVTSVTFPKLQGETQKKPAVVEWLFLQKMLLSYDLSTSRKIRPKELPGRFIYHSWPTTFPPRLGSLTGHSPT